MTKASIFAPFLQLVNAFGDKDTYAPRSLPPPSQWQSEDGTRSGASDHVSEDQKLTECFHRVLLPIEARGKAW